MIDVFVVAEGADAPEYRRPNTVAAALHAGGLVVRSVTILDKSTGLTSTWRDSAAG
jgi:hypothetical protein